jgi:hypothetical protein
VRRLPVALAACAMVFGCSNLVERSVPTDADRLGRSFVVALHDAGYPGIVPLTKPATVHLPGFEAGVAQMRALLPQGPIDTLQLSEWEMEAATDRPRATKLTYFARGRDRSARVELWIERGPTQPFVETVRIGPANR